MRTIEERVQKTLEEEASRLPNIAEALTLVAKPPMNSKARRRRGLVWAAAVAVATVSIAAPALLLGDRTDNGDLTQPAAPVTSTGLVPIVTVSEIADPALPLVGPPSERIQEAYATTGEKYDELDELPDHIQDVAVTGQRIILTGGGWRGEVETKDGETGPPPGELEQTAAIWYSDGGPWIEATIEYRPEIHLGEEIGDHLLPDGIRDVVVTDYGIVAWTPILTVAAHPIGPPGSMEPTGTLILTSTTGATWDTHLIAERVVQVEGFGGGYVAVVSVGDSNHPTSKALWSRDLHTWTEIFDFGGGIAFATATRGQSVIVGVRFWETATATNPDGTTFNYVVEGSEEDIWFEMTAEPAK